MNLTLFDLDYTLIPVDSDHCWSAFLARIGAIDGEEHNRKNDYFFEQYKAGTMVIEEFLEFQLAPLAVNSRDQLDQWHQQFMAEEILPNIKDSARDLVKSHQDRGDICAIVTATNEFITAPIGQLFEVDHLMGIQLETKDGQFTGRHTGTPSYREGKITRTNEWLKELGHTLDSFDESSFYSDSINDLPLMELVSNPVAANPDDRLEKIAKDRNWKIVRLFETGQ